MSPKEISEVLFSIFSDDGYKVGNFNIQSKSPLTANVFSDEKQTSIKFGNNRPKASIKRFITLYAYVEEIVFGKSGGSIKLKNFPDINFSYENSLISLLDNSFGCNDELVSEINNKYTDSTKNKIAHKCLQYGTEWAKIVSNSNGFAATNASARRELRSQCINFVVENVRHDVEQEYGSVILTYLLVFIIIPAVARFVITKLLEKYF